MSKVKQMTREEVEVLLQKMDELVDFLFENKLNGVSAAMDADERAREIAAEAYYA